MWLADRDREARPNRAIRARGVLAVSLAVGAVLAAGCSTGGASSAGADGAVHPSWAIRYDSLEELAASADLVVVATVSSDGERGPEVVDDAPDRMAYRSYTLDLESVLKGPYGDGDQVALLELAYGQSGDPMQLDGLPWSERGDRGVYFLRRSEEHAGAYVLLTDQGRFLFGEDGVASASEAELNQRYVGTSPDAFVQAVETAVATADATGMEPKGPDLGVSASP